MTATNNHPDALSGPETLTKGLRMLAEAHTALQYADAGSADMQAAQLAASIGRGYIAAAQVVMFAVLAAGESDTFGKPWADLLDPTGLLRLAEEKEAAARRATYAAGQYGAPSA